MRKDTTPNVDHKIFRNTAIKSKKINIDPKIYRGGIRF